MSVNVECPTPVPEIDATVPASTVSVVSELISTVPPYTIISSSDARFPSEIETETLPPLTVPEAIFTLKLISVVKLEPSFNVLIAFAARDIQDLYLRYYIFYRPVLLQS